MYEYEPFASSAQPGNRNASNTNAAAELGLLQRLSTCGMAFEASHAVFHSVPCPCHANHRDHGGYFSQTAAETTFVVLDQGESSGGGPTRSAVRCPQLFDGAHCTAQNHDFSKRPLFAMLNEGDARQLCAAWCCQGPLVCCTCMIRNPKRPTVAVSDERDARRAVGKLTLCAAQRPRRGFGRFNVKNAHGSSKTAHLRHI